jgi:asparagine synthase (glutamine-hydrolysing)
MCGFAIAWDKSGKRFGADLGELKRVMDGIHSHRGPDSSILFENSGFIFSFDRLQITGDDIEGIQPYFIDENRNLSFNGEIYNYESLAVGFDLNLDPLSDTRTLGTLIKELGYNKSLKSNLFGQYAIAIADFQQGRIDLIRDPYGEKPLFFYNTSELAIVTSELTALRKILKVLRIEMALEHSEIQFLLATGFSQAPRTIYRDISQVAPGLHITLFKNQTIYQDTNSASDLFAFNEKLPPLTQEIFDEVIFPSFKQICREYFECSGVPALLYSGGIDSSLLALIGTQIGANFVAHSIAFPNTPQDESGPATAISKQLGFRHQVHQMSPTDAHGELMRLILGSCDPLGDPSILPTRFLARAVSLEHKVALGGDGADEIFFGYHRMHQLKLASDNRINLQYLDLYGKPRFAAELFGINTDLIYKSVKDKISDLEDYNSLREYEIKGYLANNILFKVDRASMAYGLEVRSPFLDMRLANLISRLDPSVNSSELENKSELRSMLSRHLPSHLAQRQKMGFTPPFQLWLRGALLDPFAQVLHDFPWVEIGISKASVTGLLNQFKSGDDSVIFTLWGLFMLANHLNS